MNYLKNKIMAFRDIFKDDNNINEKNVVGFGLLRTHSPKRPTNLF